jgi:hypothetical protein
MKRFRTHLQEATRPPKNTVFNSYSNDKINDDITVSMGNLPGFGVKKISGGPEDPIYAVGQEDRNGDPVKSPKYFACQGPLGKDPLQMLQSLGYIVVPSDEVFSKGTTTWVIAKKFGTENFGTHFVNKYNPNNSLETKWLTPERMGVATNEPLDIKNIVKRSTVAINNNKMLTEEVRKKLIDCLKVVQVKGKNYFKGGKSQQNLPKKHKTYVIDLIEVGLTRSELSTISKDFGEILSAIWAIRNIGFTHIIFPSNPAEPLVDFYGVALQGKMKYPVSVKSGSGASTSMKNLTVHILDLLKDPEFRKTYTKREVVIVKEYLDLITREDTMSGIIRLNQLLKTPAIKELESVTGISGKMLTANSLANWLCMSDKKAPNYKSSEWLQSSRGLGKFYKTMGSFPESATWKTYDKGRLKVDGVGVIVGPLGMSLIGIMNESEEIRGTLTKCARSIILLQMNVDVKSKNMSFRRGKFKDFMFHFSWGGGSTNPHRNKFGFKAETFK